MASDANYLGSHPLDQELLKNLLREVIEVGKTNSKKKE